MIEMRSTVTTKVERTNRIGISSFTMPMPMAWRASINRTVTTIRCHWLKLKNPPTMLWTVISRSNQQHTKSSIITAMLCNWSNRIRLLALHCQYRAVQPTALHLLTIVHIHGVPHQFQSNRTKIYTTVALLRCNRVISVHKVWFMHESSRNHCQLP